MTTKYDDGFDGGLAPFRLKPWFSAGLGEEESAAVV